jgi:hypothetical protein
MSYITYTLSLELRPGAVECVDIKRNAGGKSDFKNHRICDTAIHMTLSGKIDDRVRRLKCLDSMSLR